MSRLKITVRVIAFISLFAFVFVQVEDRIVPTWDWPGSQERLTRSITGVYQEDRDSLDLLWLGTSHMQNGISPMEIYRHTGLFSYNIATPAQPLLLTYYRLKSVLKEQSPRIVFLDASGLFASAFSNSLEARWLKTLACYPASHFLEKVEVAASMPKLKTDNSKIDEAISTVFPIIRFHTNYLLTEDSFVDLHENTFNLAKGHVIKTWVNPVGSAVVTGEGDEDEEEADEIDGEGEKVKSKLRSRLKVNYDALERIKQLCDRHRCELVLTKIPLHPDVPAAKGRWTKEKHEIAQEVSDKLGVRFLDLNDVDIGIDWTTDTCDAGCHLNEWGAVKASRYCAQWLVEEYGFNRTEETKQTREWDAQLEIYDDELSRFEMQLVYNCKDYLERLKQGDYTILCAVSGTVGDYWSDSIQNAFSEATGAKENLCITQEDESGRAYVGAFVDKKPLQEVSGKTDCSAEGTLPDGRAFMISSAAVNNAKSASIIIEGTEYVTQGSGMCIVVYDNEMHCVIDSAVFNTQREDIPSAHNSRFFPEFRLGVINYEFNALKAAGL